MLARTTKLAVVLLWLLPLAACMQEISRTDPWAGYRNMGWADKGQNDTTTQTPSLLDEGWAIEMRRFTGPQRRERAILVAEQLRLEAAMPDVWIRDENGQTVLYRGRYATQDDPFAQSDLEAVRALNSPAWGSFSQAHLVPLSPDLAPSGPLDLRRYAGTALYTLQVAFFDPAGGPQFRAAAEQYARQLRDKGEQAFFYHGPTMSIVTVGLFSQQDLQTLQTPGPGGAPIVTQAYGPRVRELQQRFPENLGNGMTVVETNDHGARQNQRSFLVPVPDLPGAGLPRLPH